jgi:hypothetical protein
MPFINARDMEHYLTGLSKAGVTEFPFGFRPAEHVDQRLRGDQIRNLLYGRSFQVFATGTSLPAEFHFSEEGFATWQVRNDVMDKSPTRIEGDSACFRFAVITRGREACYHVFLNPGDDRFPKLTHYAYAMVGPELYYFSPKD